MKYYLLILILCLSSFIFGQKQITFLKAGLNIADISTESNIFKSRTSFHAGLGSENKLSDKFSLAPEILFSSQGANLNEVRKREYRLNYVNLAILFRYYPDGGFYFEAGPQAGILVSARQTAEDEYDSNIPNIKGQDYGFNIGLGFRTKSTLGINARYYFGLRDINDLEMSEQFKNGVFQISLNIYLN